MHRLNKETHLLASRVPLSGAIGGDYSGDLLLKWQDGTLKIEVKARRGGAGWKVIASWMKDNDVLLLKQNNAEPLVVLPWRTWLLNLSFMPAVAVTPFSESVVLNKRSLT